MENDVSADILYNKVGGEINIRGKKDFKARSITGDKGGHYLMTKWIIHPEDVVILSLQALTPSSQNTLKKKTMTCKKEIVKSTFFFFKLKYSWLDGRESEWTPGVGDGQGGLACCGSWGRRVRHDWATERSWTESWFTVLLASGEQQSDPVLISILFQIIFHTTGYYKILTMAPCATYEVLVVYFLYVVCVCQFQTPNFSLPSFLLW